MTKREDGARLKAALDNLEGHIPGMTEEARSAVVELLASVTPLVVRLAEAEAPKSDV